MICSQQNSDKRDIFMSIGSSGIFALLVEIGFWLNDRSKFGYLKDDWERVAIYNRNSNESGVGYDDISDRYSNVPRDIRLTYHGDGEYTGTATYEGGKLNFSLNMSKEKNLSGNGTYQYEMTKENSITSDIGHYSFIVDQNRKKIYISHENILPSGNAKGLEVWQRPKASA